MKLLANTGASRFYHYGSERRNGQGVSYMMGIFVSRQERLAIVSNDVRKLTKPTIVLGAGRARES